MTTHRPQRTCVGCRVVTDQSQLLRWVRDPQDATRLLPDPDRRRSGRGAWLHRDPECARTAVRRGGFSRAFRTGELTVELEALLSALSEVPIPGPGTHQSPEPESGSEAVETR